MVASYMSQRRAGAHLGIKKHMFLRRIKTYLFLFLFNSSIATADNIFQGLDNQISLGYGYTSASAYNPSFNGTKTTTNSSSVNLHLEQLFDNSLWFGGDGSFIFKAKQNGPAGAGFSQSIQELNFPASLSAKLGYSFNWSNDDDGFQVIPYLTLGRSLNYNGATILQNGFVDSYYNMFGGGVRLEYAFVSNASLFFDQTIGYLNDPSTNQLNLSTMSYSSSLGIKYNVSSHLQLGAQGIFNQLNLINGSTIGYDSITFNSLNTAQTSYGGLFSLAYLFDQPSTSGGGRISASNRNTMLASFDNNYSLGLGVTRSTNSYASGNNPTINSNSTYFNLGVTHLFENNIWASINGQLTNSLSQTNLGSGFTNSHVPTYIGFPGNAQANVGYAFPLANADVQFIPYLNGGIIMNINSYNIRTNSSLVSAISQDMYLQYGLGGRAEYAINQYIQIYVDQLMSRLNDQSTLGINGWGSNSQLGAKFNVWDKLQLGVSGFYNVFSPSGNTSSSSGVNYAVAQQTIGTQFDIGITY